MSTSAKPPTRFRVLFLCTANASRSQMSEAIARAFHADVIDPVSAGSRPSGWVHPLAVRAMEALGIGMDGAYSKSAENFIDEAFDLVVMLCDSAAQDCPWWPGATEIERWSIKDPSYGPDDPATRYDRFLITRDELRARIGDLAKRLEERRS